MLFAIIQDAESRNLENINATENAISAVTKICKYTQGMRCADISVNHANIHKVCKYISLPMKSGFH